MPRENSEQLDLNELYDICMSKFDLYDKKISHIMFIQKNIDKKRQKEKNRIVAFRSLLNGLVNNNELKDIVHDYTSLLRGLLENINCGLDLYLELNDKDPQKYNFALNVAAYFATSSKYEIYVQYIKYLQVEYANQFQEMVFFMRSQTLNINNTEEKRRFEQKIKTLDDIIHTFSKKIHGVEYSENILKRKKEMDAIFNEIQKKKRKKYDKTFPNSIGILRKDLSDAQEALHDYTNEVIDSFLDISMEFELDYFSFIRGYLRKFLKKIP